MREQLSTPGAKVPPFDPFKQGEGHDILPRGTRITLLLSRSPVLTPIGLRAVSGEAVGFAVASPHWMDIRLERMITWFHSNPPGGAYEVLPSTFRSTFRVEILGSVRRTIELLTNPGDEGRVTVCAVELPCKKCWRCGMDIEGKVFCSNCGWRASVGQGPWPQKRPRSNRVPYCPGCWMRNPPKGRYCAACGLDWSLIATLRKLEPRELDLVFAAGARRLGRVRARVRMATLNRSSAVGKPRVLLRVDHLRDASGTPLVPEEFSTIVMVSGKIPLTEVVRKLSVGECLQVAELIRHCGSCSRTGGAQAPLVLGRYCVKCGVRGRLFMHPNFSRHLYAPPLRVLTHACGVRFLETVHAYCGGCGQNLWNLRPSLNRFARLR